MMYSAHGRRSLAGFACYERKLAGTPESRQAVVRIGTDKHLRHGNRPGFREQCGVLNDVAREIERI